MEPEPTWVEPELPDMGGHTADHRPDAYWEDDLLIVRASALGSCEKSLIGQAMGMDRDAPPAKIVEKWDESASFEDELVLAAIKWIETEHCMSVRLASPRIGTDRGKFTGLANMGGQWGFTRRIGGKVGLRGHLDGAAIPYTWMKGMPRPSPFGIEVKALGPTYWDAYINGKQNDLLDTYHTQVMAYMWVTRMPFVFTVGQKVDGEIKDIRHTILWPEQVAEFVAPIVSKMLRVWQFVTNNELPDCDETMWPCPLWYLHEKQAEQIEEVDDPELRSMIWEYQEMKADMEERKETIAELKEGIIQRMGRGKKKVGEYVVNIFSSEYPEKQVTRKAYSTTTVKIETKEKTT